ncbi:MAG: [Fe-Fe] hydrogenase large subunit C-terminal domain-containing protein [Bacillota bacterium]
MDEYFHSVQLDEKQCIGCTNCIKRCPTEAIRVKNGKARIIKERCIDCGECIRVCPQHAKNGVTDSIKDIENFKYKVALPAPSILSQFDENVSPGKILASLKLLGFDDVVEVSRGADIVSHYTKEMINKAKKLPLISSSCPVIVRLIQIRFPSLLDNIIPIESPMEVAAGIARQKAIEKTGLPTEDIGIFFISPCPAKMTSVKEPLGNLKSNVDGVISIKSLYPCMQKNLKKDLDEEEFYDSGKAIGWARSGGETFSLGIKDYLCVDGIENVIQVLDEVENEKIREIQFIECLACNNGCVGGSLTVENPFVARNRIRRLAEKYMKTKEIAVDKAIEEYSFTENIDPKNVHKLDENIMEAMKKMERISCIQQMLPNLDCGACGSPNCKALAEDIVLGYSELDDCMVIFRDKYKKLNQEKIEHQDRNNSEQQEIQTVEEDQSNNQEE